MISCLPDHRLDAYFAAEITPDNSFEARRLVGLYADFAEGCARRHPQLLGHVDTVSVARDMDRIRAALGERRLNFLGFSYGSHLGTTYAELFPERIRTMALDGILDHSLALDDLMFPRPVRSSGCSVASRTGAGRPPTVRSSAGTPGRCTTG